MSTVVRIKRRLNDEEPLSTLVLNCKRRKTDTASEPVELSAVLKLAATITKDEDIAPHVKKLSKSELEGQFKKHPVDPAAKLRFEREQNAKKNRYKIVNCFRTNLEEDLQVYDVERANETESKLESVDFVYDLYYATSDDLGSVELEDYVSLYAYNDVFVFGSAQDNGLNDSDAESEDSNAEDNWKNDYPDESDLESVTEDDMAAAMKRCDLSDLSSDDGEEGFVYSIDSEAAGFEEDIDESDVQRYGERYARFKARNKPNVETTGLDKELYYGDIDEEEYYY